MVDIVPVQGKESKLVVGVGNVEVLGIRTGGPDQSWNTEDLMHWGDEAPTAMMNYKVWSISFTATYDIEEASNPGLKDIYEAFDAGSSLAFKLYPDEDVTTTYWTSTAHVMDWKVTQDAQKNNVVTFTFKPATGASVLTWTHS
jgi:hypothetical protein